MLIVTTGVFSQRVIDTVAVDDATAHYSDSMLNPTSIQILCTQVSGTTEGTLRLQASLDGVSWTDITSDPEVAVFYPNDTITMVDGLNALIKVRDKTFPYWRASATGGTGDNTSLTIKYSRN